MRQILLDTETTGLSPAQGHRIIEIGCLELVNRRLTGKSFHTYLQPDRSVDEGAVRVHGITNQFLENMPRFQDIVQDFKNFIKGSELIIHNAPFDVGFIENEFLLIKDKEWKILADHCQIIDTLQLARQKHPGQRNNLDALCKRYGINNDHREKHGALLDAQILCDVYLAMTGGQNTLSLDETIIPQAVVMEYSQTFTASQIESIVIMANEQELAAHSAFLDKIESKIGVKSIWRSELEISRV